MDMSVLRNAKFDLGVWDCYFKVRFLGSYWKISLILSFAKLLGLKTEYLSAGTGRG